MAIDLLEVHALCKTFRAGGRKLVRAVDDVSFSVPVGKTLGLVGESGCGKTTIGRLIMRLYMPDSGEICFDGKNIHSLSRKESYAMRRSMQMVFQDPKASLNPYLTVQEIIADGMRIHNMCSCADEEHERICELLHSVGLSAYQANCYPHVLSGGQQQRVGIARALALEPRLLICDEVVSALDVSMQSQIVNLLLRQQQEKGLSYLFISHDLHLVKHVSDIVAVMYAGSIVEYADAQTLIRDPMHPYTKRLIASVPQVGQTIRIEYPEGALDSSVNYNGCRFAGQCPHATEKCRSSVPTMHETDLGHFVRCHHFNDGT